MVDTADVSDMFASDDRVTAHMTLIAAHSPANCALKAPPFSQLRFVSGDDATAGSSTKNNINNDTDSVLHNIYR